MHFLLRISLLWLLFSGACASLRAQDSALVEEITFEGLKRHEASYLRRFLRCEAGQPFVAADAEADVQRLRNLYSVADARYRLDTLKTRQLRLVFGVEEAWTLFPQVSVNGVAGNVWFELGATEINLLGRGLMLAGAYRNIDGRHNGQVFFRQPYLLGSRWGIAAGLHRYASTEPLYFAAGGVWYDYTNLSAELGLSYEFSQGHHLELSGVYFIEDYQKTPEQDLPNPPGPEGLRIPKGLFKLTHRLDRIDHHYFYQQGLLNVTRFESVYNSDDGSWFHLFLNDLHYFHRLGLRGNLALRLRTGLSTNLNTPFAPFVLDSRVNIRGAGNRVDRGTGTLILNLEYRHTLWEGENFALQGIVFSDAGAWRTAGGDFEDFVNRDYLRHFVGPGLRFIYKKAHNASIRLDYGFDLYQAGERGLVVGVGQYF